MQTHQAAWSGGRVSDIAVNTTVHKSGVGGWVGANVGQKITQHVIWFQPHNWELGKTSSKCVSGWHSSVRRYTVRDKTAQTFNKMCTCAQ